MLTYKPYFSENFEKVAPSPNIPKIRVNEIPKKSMNGSNKFNIIFIVFIVESF